MKKNKQNHLFALCAFVSFLAGAAVVVKCVEIANTNLAIRSAEAQVRGLYQVDIPNVSEFRFSQYSNNAGGITAAQVKPNRPNW